VRTYKRRMDVSSSPEQEFRSTTIPFGHFAIPSRSDLACPLD